MSIHINGSVVTRGCGITPRAVSRTLTLVRNDGGQRPSYGYVGDVRIWSVARTEAQIRADMPMGSIRSPMPGLAAAWPLGATGESILADVSGNGRSLRETGVHTYHKLDSGLLVMRGNNTASGPLTVWGGTLQVGEGGTTGSLGSGGLVNHGTVVFHRSDDFVEEAVISGKGGLVKSGTGTLTLNGENSYLGATTLAAGTLRVGDGGARGQLGSGAVTNHGTLILSRRDPLRIPGAIRGSGRLIQKGVGDAILMGDVSLEGGLEVQEGTLALEGNGLFSVPFVRISEGACLDISRRPAGLVMRAPQTWSNVGGSFRLVGSLDASEGDLRLKLVEGAPALSVCRGVLRFSPKTHLTLGSSGRPLEPNVYRVIAKQAEGAVEGVLPRAAMEEMSLVPGTLAQLSIVSGELILTVRSVVESKPLTGR